MIARKFSTLSVTLFVTLVCLFVGVSQAKKPVPAAMKPAADPIHKPVCKPYGPKVPLILSTFKTDYNLTRDPDNLLGANNSTAEAELFQFQQCNVTAICKSKVSPGCIFPIAPRQVNVFGHVKHLPTGKCLHHNTKHLTFSFEDCPKSTKAEAHLSFWFESLIESPSKKKTPKQILDVVFIGHKHSHAEPDRYYWLQKSVQGEKFKLKTQKKVSHHDNSIWLHGPIRF